MDLKIPLKNTYFSIDPSIYLSETEKRKKNLILNRILICYDIYVRTYVCPYVRMYVYTYVCTYVCMYVRIQSAALVLFLDALLSSIKVCWEIHLDARSTWSHWPGTEDSEALRGVSSTAPGRVRTVKGYCGLVSGNIYYHRLRRCRQRVSDKHYHVLRLETHSNFEITGL